MKGNSMKRILILFTLCSIFITAAIAQTGNAQSTKRTIIHAGKLFDAKSGKVLSNQTIVVEGGNIVSVGADAVAAKDGDTVIDLSKSTVLPGLMDAHTHITSDPTFGYQELGISVPKEALIGAKNARTTLMAGFTSIRNVAAGGYADVALSEMVDAGELPGPHMLVSGPALGITGGHCDNNLLPFEYHAKGDGVADGIAAVQQKVREVIKYGATVVKICATGGVLSKGDDPQASQFTLDEMKAIVADAHRLERRVAAHAHGKQGIIWASEAGVDSIEHGSYIDDEGIAVLKKNGTYLVPTVYLTEWLKENMDKIGFPAIYRKKMEDVTAIANNNIAHAIKSGVKIAFGTDAAVYPHGLNAHQFNTYVKLGMTPVQAIQSATVSTADLFGWGEKTGSIEKGKWADIIAVDGDPTVDVTTLEHVKFVMKNGVVFKNEYAK